MRSLYPLWEDCSAKPGYQDELENEDYDRFGLLNHRRESIGTSVLDAVPQQRVVLPGPTFVPFVLALVVAFIFIGVMIDLILVPIGAFFAFLVITLWHWPNAEQRDMGNITAGPPEALPTSTVASSRGSQPPFWWGMLGLITIETVVFGALVSSYYYLRAASPEWPLGGIDPPELLLPSINAAILLASSIPMYIADSGIRKGNQLRLKVGLVVSFILGAIFLVLKYVEYSGLDYNWSTNAYSSIVWTITGFHSAHVLALLLKTLVVGALAFQGYFNEQRNAAVQANGLYWHFVVLVWIPLFFTLYLAPRLL